MSQATKNLNITETVRSLMTIGGKDCGIQTQYPDLFVKGGAIVKKTLCTKELYIRGNSHVIGNTEINGNLIVHGDALLNNVVITGTITGNLDCIINEIDPGTKVCANQSNITADISGNRYLTLNNYGGLSVGYTSNGGSFQSNNKGSIALGYAKNNGTIYSGNGAMAIGQATQGGNIVSYSRGAMSFGYSYGNSIIISGGNIGYGSLAFGSSMYSGNISSVGSGSFSGGICQNLSYIKSQGLGSFAFGSSRNYGGILSDGPASIAIGSADYTSRLLSDGRASIAGGYSRLFGVVKSSGSGSLSLGYSGHGGYLFSSNFGSVALGYACYGGSVIASDYGSIAMGHASNGEITRSTRRGAIALGGNVAAMGLYSMSTGKNAMCINDHSFCWSDGARFSTINNKEFAIRASGNVRINNGAPNELTTLTENNTTTWSYIPKNPSYWTIPAPVSISEAIDRIAANIYIGTPI